MTQENKDLLVSLLAEYKQYDISNQIDYDKFYLYSIITHSTAIEGSTVTELEAQLLFDEGITSSNRTMYEQMMNLDLNHLKLDIENYLKSVHEDVQKDVQKKLSDRQLIILNLIRMKNNITLAGISEELGVSIKTVQRELKELREKGIVERQGGRTYGTWVITE